VTPGDGVTIGLGVEPDVGDEASPPPPQAPSRAQIAKLRKRRRPVFVFILTVPKCELTARCSSWPPRHEPVSDLRLLPGRYGHTRP
jgi:hypothetical protein